MVFTQSAVLLRKVVCLSVRLSVCRTLSVTLRYPDHAVGWKSSKILRLVSLGCSRSADPNITDLLQGEHPKVLAGMGRGIENVAFGVHSHGEKEF